MSAGNEAAGGIGARASVRLGVQRHKVRTLLFLVLVAGALFFGSILFILSRAPRP